MTHFTQEEKMAIIERFAGDESERLKIGLELLPTIIESYLNEAIPFFNVRNAEQGEIVFLSKEENIPSFGIGEDGKVVEVYKKGSRIFPIEYWNTSSPKVGVAEIATRQFDIVERTIDKIKFQTINSLYNRLLSLLDKSCEINKNVRSWNLFHKIISLFRKGHFLNTISKLISSLDVKKCIMTSNTYNKLKHFVYQSGSVALVNDFNNKKLYNLDILIVGDDSFENKIFFLPDKVAELIIRVPFTALLADGFLMGKPTYGWLFCQREMMCIVKSNLVSCFKI